MKKLVLVLLLILVVDCHAKQQAFSASCGDASLKVLAEDRSEDDAPGFNEVSISVVKGSSTITVKEDGPDNFSIGCLSGKNKKYYLVYQSVCNGSACHDLDNFGIIAIDGLKVLLKPDDNNRNQAAKILGLKSGQILRKINESIIFPK